jgi:hypothetical protein
MDVTSGRDNDPDHVAVQFCTNLPKIPKLRLWIWLRQSLLYDHNMDFELFLGAKSTSIRDCVRPSVGRLVRPLRWDYVEN